MQVYFFTLSGVVKAVDRVSFSLEKGKILGLVGENGAGKSMIGLSLLRLIRKPGKIVGGKAYLDGIDLFSITKRKMSRIRGDKIFMIFQSPGAALNPTMKIRAQISEAIVKRWGLSKKKARNRAAGLLEKVGISTSMIDAYPFQLSGGMRQRVLFAMALGLKPKVLIADEPTTNLDSKTQKEILRLIMNLKDELSMAILYITHDLRVVAGIADEVAVLYKGSIVELQPVNNLFKNPKHPYIKKIIKSAQYLNQAAPMEESKR